MNKSELRENIKKLLRSICSNVEDSFVFPEEKANLQNAFPYITVVFGDMDFPEGTNRMMQQISIIGIVRGKEGDLITQQDKLENDIFRVLYKNELFQCSINQGSNTNLFKPFGFEAGIFPPYAGIRFEIEVPQVKIMNY